MVLNLNSSPLKQEKGTTRFGLNLVTDQVHMGSDANELGNILCTTLESDLAGPPILLDRNRFFLPLKNNSVWIVNTSTCEAIQHCKLDCFGWDTLDEEHPVTGIHRVVRGCEDIVYLFDGIHGDKFINLSRPEKQQTLGEFDCSKFDFDVQISHPTIDREILNSGGNLEYGNYNFAIEFMTSNKDSLFISPVDINYTPITISNNEGALNLSTNLPDVGGKPLSNKSIKLTITNVPEDAILARIVVFRHITFDGLTYDAHVVGNLIPVTSSTLEYIYRGFNTSNGDYLVDGNEYLKVKAIYQSSFNGIQVNNRLVRYNLVETIRSYDNYQQKASNIHAKYIVDVVDKSNPNIYLLNQTFLGGEIILPCIHWVHKDGSISNAYPLIGRSKLSSDEVLVDDILNVGQQVEKWKYFDTSIKDGTPINNYVSSGEFGYYESEQLYNNPPNYCGSNYWGVDYEGNNLEDTPVRLFIVPDRSVEPHDVNDTIRPIGIWFDETTIEFPNDEVVGYYFSTVILNQSNIEAKGIGFNTFLSFDSETPDKKVMLGWYNYAPISDLYIEPDYNLLTPNSILGNEYVTGTHITTEGYWPTTVESTDKFYDGVFEDDLPYADLDVFLTTSSPESFVSETNVNKVITKSLVIQPRTIIENIENGSQSNAFNYVRLDSNFSSGERIKYLSVKNNGTFITNIWSITTRRITNLNEILSFNGGYFIAPLNIDNIADMGNTRDGILWGSDDEIIAYPEVIKDYYVESKYNSYVRHNGTNLCNKNIQNENNYFKFFFDKTVEPYKDKFKVKDSICPFFAGYNKDYSYVQDLNKYSTISFVFDFCSSCTGKYPHRLIFSPQSFSDDLADGWRINRPNDYVDIPANTGAIVAIDYKDNKLVIRTQRASYFLQPNPQQMETSESNIYIGTGDFLSIPPQELNVTPVGYGGQQHKLDSLNSEKGLIWSDRQRGEIYFLGGEFKELNQPMSLWFKENLKLGHLIMTYDPYYDRLIVTCKNNWTLSYCFIEQGWKSWHSYIPDYYCYDAETFYSFSKDMWKHNMGDYTTYYDLEFPHVVELILNEGNTFNLQSVIYHSNVYSDINGYEEDVYDQTYDQVIIYNDRQSTGLQNLILNDDFDVYNVPNQTHVKRVDRNFKIGLLKDFATSSNIWTVDITSIKQGQHGYFDKLPLVDFNVNEVEMADFKSKWIGARLLSNNHKNKITLEFESSNKQNSMR